MKPAQISHIVTASRLRTLRIQRHAERARAEIAISNAENTTPQEW